MRSALIPILLNPIPGWVRNAYPGAIPSLAAHFDEGRYWALGLGQCSPEALFACTRASVKYVLNAGGVLVPIPVNGLPIGAGLGNLVEQASTNTALWCRDMTNAAWVKVNMTPMLTATGIDNTANAASTLTATAGNATVLQTLTIASSAETYSVFLKRVSGTGTINITENGGTSWTPVVLTSAWTRFSVEATLANPVIGIQIVTNGDVIAADFNRTEALAFATSPILTTSASVARAADAITSNTAFTQVPVSAFIRLNIPSAAVIAANPISGLSFVSSGRFQLFLSQANPSFATLTTRNTGGSVVANIASGNSAAAGTNAKIAGAMGASADYAVVLNGGTVVTATTAGGIPNLLIGHIGDGGFGSNQLNDYIQRIALFPTRLPNTQLQALTT